MKASCDTQSYILKGDLKRSLSYDVSMGTHRLRLKYTISKYFPKILLPEEQSSLEEKQPWLKKCKPFPETLKPWSQAQCIKNEFPNARKQEGFYLYIQNKDDTIILGRSHIKQNGQAQSNPDQEDIAEKHNDIFPKNNPHIVKCAGEMIFTKNLLPSYVNNKSGHFRPSAESFKKFARKLYLKGLLSSATKIEILEENNQNKTFSQKGIANEILNVPFQDWHYSPFRKKPFNEQD